MNKQVSYAYPHLCRTETLFKGENKHINIGPAGERRKWKIDPAGRITRLFLSIPAQLSNNESRYQPTTVLGNVDREKMTELLSNLEDSKTATPRT